MKFHNHIFIIYACCALLLTPGVSQEHFTMHKQLKRSDVSVKAITIKNWTTEVCSRVAVSCPVPHKVLKSHSCFEYCLSDRLIMALLGEHILGFYWIQRQCFDLKACHVLIWICMEVCILCTNKSVYIIQWKSKHLLLSNLILHHLPCKCIHSSGITSGLCYCEGY